MDFKKSLYRVILVVFRLPDLDMISETAGFSGCAAQDISFACPCIGQTDFPDNVDQYKESTGHAVNSYMSKLLHRQDAFIVVVDPWKDAPNIFVDKSLCAPNCFNWVEDLPATTAALLWYSVWRS